MVQTDCSTRRKTETPGARADRLAAEGYTVRRTQTLGIYFVRKPDGSRTTYRVNCERWTCTCQSTAWYGCKHLIFADHFAQVDRAKRKLAEVRARGIEYPGAYEADLSVAEWYLRRIVGAGAAVVDERRAA